MADVERNPQIRLEHSRTRLTRFGCRLRKKTPGGLPGVFSFSDYLSARPMILATSGATERTVIFATDSARATFCGSELVTMSRSRWLARRFSDPPGNTPCGANAVTDFAPLARRRSAASRRVPPVWMRSSTMTTSLPAGSPSLIEMMRLSPSRILMQTIFSWLGKLSPKRLAAQSSGKTMAAPSGMSRSFMAEWSSRLTLNGSKKKRSESAWMSKVWREVLPERPSGRCERMSA